MFLLTNQGYTKKSQQFIRYCTDLALHKDANPSLWSFRDRNFVPIARIPNTNCETDIHRNTICSVESKNKFRLNECIMENAMAFQYDNTYDESL